MALPDRLLLAALAALLCAAVTAIGLARRNPAHRPVAFGLGGLFLLAIVRLVLVSAVLRPARAAMPDPAAPFSTAGTLAAVYLDGAAFLAEVVAVPAIVAAVYLEKPRRSLLAIGAAWLLASLALALLYPSPLVRGAGLARIYTAAELASVLVSVGAIVTFSWRRLSPRAPHAVAMFLLSAEVASIAVGPWRHELFAATSWDVQEVVNLVSYAFIAALQGILWRYSSPSP